MANQPREGAWYDGFAQRVRAAMQAAGLRGNELAGRMGVSQAAVSRWASGTVPEPEQLVRLARALRVSCDYLMGAAPGLDRASSHAPPGQPKHGEDWHELPRVAWTAAGSPVDDLPSSTTWYAFHKSWIVRHWGAQAVEDPERLVVVQVIHLASAVHYSADEFHTIDGLGRNDQARRKLLGLDRHEAVKGLRICAPSPVQGVLPNVL